MKRRFFIIALVCLSLFILQGFYYLLILHSTGIPSQRPEAIVVFGGEANRAVAAIRVARETGCSQIILSDNQEELAGLKPLLESPSPIQIQLDSRAKTTDANARNTAAIVKKLGVKSIILVTSWYHIPRAAFLMRLSLMGSGVKVYPVAAEVPPAYPWTNVLFWSEMEKFWGSLGRIGLASIGIERPFFHA